MLHFDPYNSINLKNNSLAQSFVTATNARSLNRRYHTHVSLIQDFPLSNSFLATRTVGRRRSIGCQLRLCLLLQDTIGGLGYINGL